MRERLPVGPAITMVVIAALLLLGCGEETADSTGASSAGVSAASTTTVAVPSTLVETDPAPVERLTIDDDSFVNLADMTPVRGFFVDNLLDDLDATISVAENPEGGVYPVGSVVQLFPGEAMVKREAGFSSETNDWEFFELIASADGTTIRVRGGAEAVNQFGGSCADCHAQAAPQFDFICEQTNGCEPLPISRDLIELAQAADPRPRTGLADQ
jgi:hypothetical protein